MDMQTETVSTDETVEKITPPTISKRGRKLGQKTGTGKKARAAARPKTAPKSMAEKIEAIGNPALNEPAPVKDDKPAPRRKATVKVEAHKLGRTVQGLYKGASMLTGVPQFDIGEEKANQLAGAMLDMFAEFDIEISSKSASVANFIGTAMYVHAPIAVALGVRARQAKERKPRNPVAGAAEQEPAAPATPKVDPIIDAGFFDQTQGG